MTVVIDPRSEVSAYVPCFNNSATLQQTLQSLKDLNSPPEELFVVDDGSTDNSAAVAARFGVRVIQHERNLGRGAVRARAMLEAKHPLVLSCDASNTLNADFLEQARAWFDAGEAGPVGAVFGRITQRPARNAAERWRGRHLFKLDQVRPVQHRASFASGGALTSREAVLQAGNYNPNLRHSEDADLGKRLLERGFDVIYDPRLTLMAEAPDSVRSILERYWRWYAGRDERITWRGYLKLIAYSWKVMGLQDWRARDPAAVLISLLCPHYQFWRSRFQKKPG